jgi:glycerol-3-phosphate dehydrogenase subunit B
MVGTKCVRAAIDTFLEICEEENYPFQGSLSKNLRLPTALGTIHSTSFAPISAAQGNIDSNRSIVIAGITHFRDFYPQWIASNLQKLGLDIHSTIELPLPGTTPQRDLYATDIGQRFDAPRWREEVARSWKPLLTGTNRLGLPAILGLKEPFTVLLELQELLGLRIFEIPTLPPSLPGVRLDRILREKAKKLGVLIIEGSRVVGRVNGRRGAKRATGAILHTAGGPRLFTADVVLLATGGVLHGGLVYQQDGTVRESVFDLPVTFDPRRTAWTATSPFFPQPYTTHGVRVNTSLRPLGADDKPIFKNLYCAGGIIGGVDRTEEGSRQGIDLATAFRAIEVALG